MEGQLFELLYALIVPLGKLRGGKKGQQFADYKIASVLLWAAIHQRPRTWALKIDNWHGCCPWHRLPSDATVSRRSRTLGLWLVLAQLFDLFNSLLPTGLFKRMDAHPLTVGGASKDRNAKAGFGAGGTCKGYKLHEIRSSSGHVEAWRFTAMSDKEPTAAPLLFENLKGGGYITADNAYDSNALYELAGAHNHQLVAPPRPSAKGIGHQRHSPWRVRGLSLLGNPLASCGQTMSFGQKLLGDRRAIERNFAHELTAPCCQLGPLPFWVRTPQRVGPWIMCKFIILFAVQRLKIKNLRAA
jgi:hypothetical protein